MGNTSELLLSSYHRLLELTEKQLVLTRKDRYDEQIDDVLRLENQKNEYVILIDQLQRDINANDQAEQKNEAILIIISQLRSLNHQLEQQIASWYEDDSKVMKQVSSHRKTLQAYGGINYSDVISFYFDEKQ